MRNLDRNVELITFETRGVTDSGVEYFNVPIAFKASRQSVQGSWKYANQGFVTKNSKILSICKANSDWIENNSLTKFHDGDRIWLDVNAPTYTDKNAGEGADYYITNVDETLNNITLVIERLT